MLAAAFYRVIRGIEFDPLTLHAYLLQLFPPHSPFHHLVLEQAAFERAVEQRRALGGGESDELREAHVGGENVGASLQLRP